MAPAVGFSRDLLSQGWEVRPPGAAAPRSSGHGDTRLPPTPGRNLRAEDPWESSVARAPFAPGVADQLHGNFIFPRRKQTGETALCWDLCLPQGCPWAPGLASQHRDDSRASATVGPELLVNTQHLGLRNGILEPRAQGAPQNASRSWGPPPGGESLAVFGTPEALPSRGPPAPLLPCSGSLATL